MRRGTASIVLVAATVAAAGCGGSKNSAQTTTGLIARQTAVKPCSVPTQKDVANVSGIASLHRFDFAVPTDHGILCSTGYATGANTVVVTITQWQGSADRLQHLRAAQASQYGAGSIEPVAALGRGAFVAAKRYLAFIRTDHVVSLESGYADNGNFTLSPRQLLRLADTAR